MAHGKLTDLGLLLLRTTGGMMAWHGFEKLQSAVAEEGSKGAAGWDKFIDGVAYLGFPEPAAFAWAALLSELVGGLMVLLGIFPRVGAVFVAFTMFVAAFIRHWEDPFSAKEKALLYLATMLCIACVGGGKWTVESAWQKKRRSHHAASPQA